jgi:hypothetical protein
MRKKRGIAGVLAISFGIALGACSGTASNGNGDGVDVNSPGTFMYPCAEDAGVCQAPFICLFSPTGAGTRCSLSCSSDADCPKWTATGHCSGPFQSPCVKGVCQPHMCS